MSRVSFVSLAVLLCLSVGRISAQSNNNGNNNSGNNNNGNSNQPVTCANAQSINFIPTQLTGIWYEVARNPTPTNQSSCVQVNITLNTSNNLVTINTTFSTTPNTLWKNETVGTSFTLTTTNNGNNGNNGNNNNNYPNGFQISFSQGSTSLFQGTYKILATDYNNYALICGYTNNNSNNNNNNNNNNNSNNNNNNNNNEAFAVVLSRERFLNATMLQKYGAMGVSNNYANFAPNMTAITQNEHCSGASASLPLMSAVFVAIAAILKFLN